MLEYRNNGNRNRLRVRPVIIPTLHNSILPFSRRAAGTAGLLALLCGIGCTTPFSKPLLSVDAQAEAFSHVSLGLLAEASGASAAALRHLEAAIQLDPSAENLYLPAVAIALKNEQPETALRLARQLRKKQPRTLDSLLLLARAYALTSQAAEAAALFRQAVSDFPENSETHLTLARFFLSQQQPSKAIQTLESALEQPSASFEILHRDHSNHIIAHSQKLT